MKRITALVPTIVLCASLPVVAQTTLTPQISGNTVTASISLPGNIAADLTITFEQVLGLNANSVTLTAGLVNPSDPSILSRFPDPASTSIPTGFPVLVSITPAAASGFSFSGVAKVSIHTHNLTLVTNSPLRLYTSHAGGPFQDITSSLETGSVRAGGGNDSFSDFLIVADVRKVDAAIKSKFDAVAKILMANASTINPGELSDLQQRLAAARSAYDQGNVVSAISAVAAFSDEVKKHSGADIPDVWRADNSLVNVAGALRSAADTLKFSLTWKSNGAL